MDALQPGRGHAFDLFGDAVQTNSFAYDALDDLINVTDGLIHGTGWFFNQYGWLTSKTNASGATILTYSYDADGRVTNRSMMGTNTGYAYDAVGNLKTITYPTATYNYYYDAINELTNLTDSFGTTTFAYTPTGQLSNETTTAAGWSSAAISFGYTQGHRTSLTLTQPSGTWSQTYGYDGAWRMTSLASPAGSFGYQYAISGAQNLISGITLPGGASIANGYDGLARLTSTALLNPWGHVLDGSSYLLTSNGLRINITRELGMTTNIVTAGYDPIGQLTNWSGQEASGALRRNEQLSYSYDLGGNLNVRSNDSLGQTFLVDSFNQLSNVTRNSSFTLTGATPEPATSLTVNGTAALTYGDLTFAARNLTLTNGGNTFTTVAQNAYGVSTTNVLTVNLPASVNFQYDANGNLTNDGTRLFTYDAENRLASVSVSNQ